MFWKINWLRVWTTAIGVFGVAFVAATANLPSAVGAADWSAAKSAIIAGLLAGLAALVEAALHAFTRGWGDPTV